MLVGERANDMSDEIIRIVIADDHPVVRDGLAAILATQPDMEVVGEASNGHEVVALVAELKPDIVLLDLDMPELDGVATLYALREAQLHTRVLIFTAFNTDERIIAALEAGIQGYLLKGVPRAELFQAIRVIHRGGSLLQPIVASKLLRRVTQTPQEAPVPHLTAREKEVLAALARGLQNKEIAQLLQISERTVKFHISGMLSKLAVGNRTELVASAARLGLISLE
jgi:Response regulator containing a CheY-like receiver domain and an HTH DNA-binding domain